MDPLMTTSNAKGYSLRQSADIFWLLLAPAFAAVWGLSWAGADQSASAGAWTWRQVLELGALPIYLIIAIWRLRRGRAEGDVAFVLGALALTTLLLFFGVAVGLMALRDSWL
jgi:cytochrome bd-type quinol oxidase subunit 2